MKQTSFRALLLVALCLGLASPPAAQETVTTPALPAPNSPDDADGPPDPGVILGQLHTSLGEFEAVQARFGLPPGEGLNSSALESTVTGLLGDVLDELATITGTGNADFRCLEEISSHPNLAANLAAIAQRDNDPIFLAEYIKTFCGARIGDPYQHGKIPLVQASVTHRSGDLVVEPDKVWLDGDDGLVGHGNGAIDEGEWFALKLGVANRSRTTPYLSTSASLVTLDRQGRPCPLPFPAATPDGPRPPEECTLVRVLSNQVSLPELSPGEQATTEAFSVALHPARKGGYTVFLGLEVKSSTGGTGMTRLRLPVFQVPSLELSALTVDDDATGQSQGNGDGRVEPGEAVELRTHLTLSRPAQLSKVGITARQYTSFLSLPDKRIGIAQLLAGKATQASGDIEFMVPSVAEMAALPAERLDRRFFHERKVRVWLATSGCAGRIKLAKDWRENTPKRITCPYSSPGYQLAIPIDVNIEFGQLFAFSSQPVGALITVNGTVVGVTEAGLPLIYPDVVPQKNQIVYYDVLASLTGFVPQNVRVPVIWKDRTADSLTTRLHFDLAPVPPPPPPPPPPVPEREPVLEETPRVPEKLVEKQDLADFSPQWSLSVGPMLRFYKPHYDLQIQSSDRLKDPSPTAGFELGTRFYFARNFYLSAQAQLHFTTQDPAARFYAPAAQANGGSPSSVIAWADQFTGLGFALEPRFRVQIWHLLLNLGVGLQLDSTFGEVKQSAFEPGNPQATVESTATVSPLSAAARLSMELGIDTRSRWQPYLGSFFILPPNDGMDWGLVTGLEIRL